MFQKIVKLIKNILPRGAALIFFIIYFHIFLTGDPMGDQPKKQIEFKHISIEHRLPQGSINCIFQDEIGFMWFGTQSGLIRYDSHEFKSYLSAPDNKESIDHNIVNVIFKDGEGKIWVGTGGGLNIYEQETETFKNHNNDPVFNLFKSQNIRAIAEDKEGKLWVSSDRGLFKSTNNKKSFERISADETNKIGRVNTIFLDNSGDLWIGAEKGLFKRQNNNSSFKLFRILNKNDYNNEVTAIWEDKNKILWIGTIGGLRAINRSGRIIPISKEFNGKQINVVFQDKDKTIWVGTYVDGLAGVVEDLESKKYSITWHRNGNRNTSLNNNNVSAIFQDREGLIWVGTAGGGINLFDPAPKRFNHYKRIPGDPQGLSNNEIRSITCTKELNNLIWIGTNGSGIDEFHPKKGIFKNHNIPVQVSQNPRRNNVHTLCLDHRGILWVGSNGGGLFQFDTRTKKFKKFELIGLSESENILIIFKDKEKRIWIGTQESGLFVLSEDRLKTRRITHIQGIKHSLSNNSIYATWEDQDGTLWFGTGGEGLCKLRKNDFSFDKDEEVTFTHFKKGEDKCNIIHNFIASIHRDKKGRLWVGTLKGLNQLLDEETKEFKSYNVKDGLPDNVIYDILEDRQDFIWVSTNRGLSRFDVKNEEFRNFSSFDGLQGYEFNRGTACIDNKGRLYFGGFNGFNIFDPEEININSTQPPLVFTEFKTTNKEIGLYSPWFGQNKITLPSGNSSISVKFALLSFSDHDTNRYSYKLEPTHNEWQYLGNKHNLELPNLSAKNYILKVKGNNSKGVGSAVIEREINVEPFIFSTLIFIIFLGTFVALIFFVLIKLQLKKVAAEKKLKESEERYRTLVETSPDAIVLSNMEDGKIIMANKQSAILCGYTTVDEMKNQNDTIFDLLEERSRKLAGIKADRIRQDGLPRQTEYILISKNSAEIAVEISTALVKTGSDEPQFFLSIIRDIRERKEAEKKERLNRERMIQAERMVTLGTLVSGVAHELNNPASSIKMNAEIFDRVWREIVPLLDETYKNKPELTLSKMPYEKAKAKLENLIIGSMESASRIEKIISDLKDYSRPAEPGIFDRVHINQVIESSVNLISNLLKNSTNYFSIDLSSNLPIIMGNAQKLEQVFINLIQNACQALPSRDKAISISTAMDEKEEAIFILVKDEGTGILEKDLKHITDPFFTTKRNTGGTGLGLSISQQIINDHRGVMEFRSQPAKGTEIGISLPVNTNK